jgi:hypothetical protein
MEHINYKVISHEYYATKYTYAKNVARPDGEGGRDKDDDILVSFTSFGTDESFT